MELSFICVCRWRQYMLPSYAVPWNYHIFLFVKKIWIFGRRGCYKCFFFVAFAECLMFISLKKDYFLLRKWKWRQESREKMIKNGGRTRVCVSTVINIFCRNLFSHFSVRFLFFFFSFFENNERKTRIHGLHENAIYRS